MNSGLSDELKRFLLVPLCALLIWALGAIIGIGLLAISPDSLAYFGQVGDMFGVLNCLFSAIAMSGALVAIYFQAKQLREQREQFFEQHKHDEEVIRTEKLESFLTSLNNYRAALVDLSRDLRKCNGTEDKAFDVLSKLTASYNSTKVFSHLYFSDHIEALNLDQTKPVNEICAAVQAFFRELDVQKKVQLKLDAFKMIAAANEVLNATMRDCVSSAKSLTRKT